MSAFPNFDLFLPLLFLDKKDAPTENPSTPVLPTPAEEGASVLADYLTEDDKLKAESVFLKRRRAVRELKESLVKIVIIACKSTCNAYSFQGGFLDEAFVSSINARPWDVIERWTSIAIDDVICTNVDKEGNVPSVTNRLCRSFLKHVNRVGDECVETGCSSCITIVIDALTDEFTEWVIRKYNHQVVFITDCRDIDYVHRAGERLLQAEHSIIIMRTVAEQCSATICTFETSSNSCDDQGREMFHEIYTIEEEPISDIE